MTVAELFVNIGVKGAAASSKALEGVGKSTETVSTGMKSVADNAMLAKVAIAGLVYTLEKMMMGSANWGTNLTHFAAATGLSSDKLQSWQNVARKFAVEGEKVESTVEGIQSKMTDMLLGKGAPESLQMLSKHVGFNRDKARDTFYVMQKLQQFAKTMPADMTNKMLSSFGLDKDMIQFMIRNKEDMGSLHGTIISQSEASTLERVKVAFMELWQTVKIMSAHFTSTHGLFVVDELQNALKLFIAITDGVKRLGNEFPMLQKVALAAAVAMVAAFAPITATVAGLILLMGEYQKFRDEKESWFTGDVKDPKKLREDAAKGLAGKDMAGLFGILGNQVSAKGVGQSRAIPYSKEFIKPNVGSHGVSSGATINQTNNIQGVPDAKSVGDHAKKGLDQALNHVKRTDTTALQWA